MVIAPLLAIDAETFCRAFQDYSVAVTLTDKKFQKDQACLDFKRELSVGLYDQGKLVGFLLNARRENEAYDCGTGIWKEYRGQGWGTKMIRTAAVKLLDAGVTSWRLEVLDNNAIAKSIYTKLGFSTIRQLNCYRIPTAFLHPTSLVQLQEADASLLKENTPLSSSWQNANETIRKGASVVYAIVSGEKNVGYLAFEKRTGNLAQLYIEESEQGKGYGSAALKALATLTKNGEIKCNNIDDRYLPMNALLKKEGFSQYCVQQEMQQKNLFAIV